MNTVALFQEQNINQSLSYYNSSSKAISPFVNHCSLFLVSEEVLSANNALWWSQDGSKILYGSFDDTHVKDFRFPFYGSQFNQYTDIISIAYPKVGR